MSNICKTQAIQKAPRKLYRSPLRGVRKCEMAKANRMHKDFGWTEWQRAEEITDESHVSRRMRTAPH